MTNTILEEIAGELGYTPISQKENNPKFHGKYEYLAPTGVKVKIVVEPVFLEGSGEKIPKYTIECKVPQEIEDMLKYHENNESLVGKIPHLLLRNSHWLGIVDFLGTQGFMPMPHETCQAENVRLLMSKVADPLYITQIKEMVEQGIKLYENSNNLSLGNLLGTLAEPHTTTKLFIHKTTFNIDNLDKTIIDNPDKWNDILADYIWSTHSERISVAVPEYIRRNIPKKAIRTVKAIDHGCLVNFIGSEYGNKYSMNEIGSNFFAYFGLDETSVSAKDGTFEPAVIMYHEVFKDPVLLIYDDNPKFVNKILRYKSQPGQLSPRYNSAIQIFPPLDY